MTVVVLGVFKLLMIRVKGLKFIKMRKFHYSVLCIVMDVEKILKKSCLTKRCNVKRIHIALCVKEECKEYDKLKTTLEEAGFEVVYGTH